MIYISNLVSRRCRTSSRFAAALISSSVLLFGASLALSGCASSKEEQRYSWPLATASPEDTVTQLFAEKFAEEVHDLSNGAMRIQVYANSTLGGDRDLLETCADGDIPFVVQNTAPQVSFMKDLAVFDLPCVFDSLDDCRKKLDDPDFYNLISQVYTDGGYHLLGMADQGFRIMSTNKPVYSLADFKGQKIRTMENAYHLQFWKQMGANPTPMSFSEVYIGLQQGTIDAQENAYEIIVSAKLYEQQKYLISTNAVPDYTTLIVSDEFYQGLTKEQQKIIDQAAETAQEKARESADDRRVQRQKVLEDEGMQIVDVDQKTWKQMQEKCQPVYDSIRKQAGDKLVDLYMGK